MWLRPLTGKKLRRFFHWKHSGVLIPLFIGMGGIMLGVGVSMPSAEALIFNLAYVFFALASIWTLGFWLTSDALRALDPHTWSKQRKRGRNTARERIFYRIWQWVGCAACLLFLFLSIAFTHFTWNKKDLSQMGGILVPANDPDPIGGQCTIGEDEVGLYLGNYSAKTARFPVTAVQVSGKPLVVLDRNQDGSIALSVDVLSDDGRVIVRIDKNGFTVNPNNYLAVKRLDRSSLVITDQYGMEVLNARFVNKKAFQLSARLRHQESQWTWLRNPLIGYASLFQILKRHLRSFWHSEATAVPNLTSRALLPLQLPWVAHTSHFLHNFIYREANF